MSLRDGSYSTQVKLANRFAPGVDDNRHTASYTNEHEQRDVWPRTEDEKTCDNARAKRSLLEFSMKFNSTRERTLVHVQLAQRDHLAQKWLGCHLHLENLRRLFANAQVALKQI